jgi:hypothetical protein
MGCNPSAAETAEATQMADPHGEGIARFFSTVMVLCSQKVRQNSAVETAPAQITIWPAHQYNVVC